MYIVAPFVGLLGPSAFSVRLPIALLGILNIIQIYFLTKSLYPAAKYQILNTKYNLGHLAAFILAIMPWHLQYSRSAFEVTLLLTLILAGIQLFISGQKKPLYLFLSPLFFILSLYTYSTANVFSPLLFLLLLWIYKPKIDLKKTLPFLIFYSLLLFPLVFNLVSGRASNRFSQISIFSNRVTLDSVVLRRTTPWAKVDFVERLTNNKFLSYGGAWAGEYLKSFSPQFLFLSGDPEPRHAVSGFGELLLLSLPLLLIGLYNAPKLLIGLLLISALPASLTMGGGTHATRLSLMIIPLTIIIALGFSKFKKLIPIVCLILLANLFVYWSAYFKDYRYASARAWHYGFQQVFEEYNQIKPNGLTFINNTYEPSLLRFAFFSKLPPKDFQRDFITDIPSENIYPGFDGFKLGDTYFGQARNFDDFQALIKDTKNIYLAAQLKEIPGDWDFSKSPPPGLKSLFQQRNLFGDLLFTWVGSVSSK
jgi:4-amino-4-deoxy-L-arabinose transferase-like glycosyltransferase